MSKPHDTSLVQRALSAQDSVGWTDFSDHSAAAQSVTDLARFVTELARRVQQQDAEITSLRRRIKDVERP